MPIVGRLYGNRQKQVRQSSAIKKNDRRGNTLNGECCPFCHNVID